MDYNEYNIETSLLDMVTTDSYGKILKPNADSRTVAQSLVTAAELIARWRVERNKTEAYPESTVKELKETNKKLGADLLKSQLQLAKVKQDLFDKTRQYEEVTNELCVNAEKETRLEILNKKTTELDAENRALRWCFKELAHKKDS